MLAQHEALEATERGERGGVSSARQKPVPQRSANERRGKQMTTNERQDGERERKAESRDDTRSQRSARDHPHSQTSKEHRGGGSRSEREEKTVRDSRTQRDRDRRAPANDDNDKPSASGGRDVDSSRPPPNTGSASAKQRLRYKVRLSVCHTADTLVSSIPALLWLALNHTVISFLSTAVWKIIKIVASRCVLMGAKYVKNAFAAGASPWTQLGSLQHSPDTPIWIKGPTSKGRERRGWDKREGKAKEGGRWGKGTGVQGREWKGKE